MTILVITHRKAFEADTVIDELRVRSVPFFRLNTDFQDVLDGLAIGISADPEVILSCDGRQVNLREISAAWFHQPPPDPGQFIDSNIESRLRGSSFSTALSFVFEALSVRWLNRPSYVFRAANKVTQLEAAKGAGLSIPETLVSNQSEQISKFAVEHGGQVIVKNLSSPWLVSASKTVASFSKKLDKEMLEDPSSIAYAPLIYQRFIERSADVRVVYVGGKTFSACIRPDSRMSMVDIRRVPLDSADYREIELPSEIVDQISRMMRGLTLEYASMDFAIDHNSRWFFLDLNCTGAYLWVERLVGHRVTSEICEFLQRASNSHARH